MVLVKVIAFVVLKVLHHLVSIRKHFQEVCLLCEIVENRFEIVYKSHGYNPSSLSGSIEQDTSKIIIALPMEVFKKSLSGGFSCINTRLRFDTEILMPNNSPSEFNKMSIDQTFKSYKRQDLKVGYKLQVDGEKRYFDRRVISKIFKLDENNQYGYAIAKPLPTSCIKEHKRVPIWQEFNLSLETVDLDDKIGHFFRYKVY